MKYLKKFENFKLNEELNPAYQEEWNFIAKSFGLSVVQFDKTSYNIFKLNDKDFFCGEFIFDTSKETEFKYYEGGLFSEEPEIFTNIEDMFKYIKDNCVLSTNEGYNLKTLKNAVENGNNLYVKIKDTPGIYKVLEVDAKDIHNGDLKVKDISSDNSEVIAIAHDDIAKTITDYQLEDAKKEEL